MLAWLIDLVLVQIVAILVVLPLVFALGASLVDQASLEELEVMGQAFGSVMGILIQWLWFTIAESSSWQSTVGKNVLGLQVVDEGGQRIGFGRRTHGTGRRCAPR